MSSNGALVSDDMRAAVGRVVDWGRSFPVSASDVRRWLIAVYHPQPPPRVLWMQSDADLIAPAEFNPFAWLLAEARIPATPRKRGDPDRFEKALGLAGPGLAIELNGGVAAHYGVPMRVGDVITSETRLADYHERRGRLGRMLITETDVSWTNQHGAPVVTGRGTSIRYALEGDRTRPRPRDVSAWLALETSAKSEAGADQSSLIDGALVSMPPIANATPGMTLASAPHVSGLEQWNRFAGVNDEFVRIHMDPEAGRRAGYTGAIGMGRLLWSYVHNLLRKWLNGTGQIESAELQFRASLQEDSYPVCCATVTEVRSDGNHRWIDLAVEVVDSAGRLLAPGRATLLTATR